MTSPKNITQLDPVTIGNIIQQIRHSRHMTQIQLALQSHQSESTIARIESGQRELKVSELQSLLNVLHHDVTILITPCNDPCSCSIVPTIGMPPSQIIPPDIASQLAQIDKSEIKKLCMLLLTVTDTNQDN